MEEYKNLTFNYRISKEGDPEMMCKTEELVEFVKFIRENKLSIEEAFNFKNFAELCS